VGVVILKGIVHLIQQLPVDEVVGAQDIAAGHEVHGGARHIISITHADDIGVGEVGVDYGIGGAEKLFHMRILSDLFAL